MCTETYTDMPKDESGVSSPLSAQETQSLLNSHPKMRGHEDSDCKKHKTFDERYKLCEILGQGTFGKVYKCVEQGSERYFAVKKVTVTDEEIGKDLAREVSIWKELKQTNVVLLDSTFSEGNVVHLVMEYVDGKSLFDEMLLQTVYTEKEACVVMKQKISSAGTLPVPWIPDLGPLSTILVIAEESLVAPVENLTYVGQLFQVLEYIHTRRIVHRDVKVDNIILKRCTRTNCITVKLLDFGLARKLPYDSDVITCDAEGAPLFLAPEIILEDPIGREVDIWACGVIFFLLLVGYPPFWSDDDAKLFSQITRGRYSMASSHWEVVSDDAKDLVKRTLVTSPCKRVTATKALKHPWFDDLLAEETHSD